MRDRLMWMIEENVVGSGNKRCWVDLVGCGGIGAALMIVDVDALVLIGRGCLEENSASGGSGTADVFLAVGGLLGLTLDGLEAHDDWLYCVRGCGGGWL